MGFRPSGITGAALVLALASSARAEDGQAQPPAPTIEAPQPARSMTLGEALAYAKEHQPAIRAAVSRVKAQMETAKIPSGQWLPTIGLTLQGFGMTANNTTGTYIQPAYMDIPRIGGTASRTESSAQLSPYASTFAGAGLTQELFDFGRIGAQRAAADALVDVSKHDADADRLDVDFGVEESYFSVLAAKSVIQAADQAYERARVHRDLAKRGVDSGLRPPIELTRAEADLGRYDVGRIRARGGLSVAQAVLAAAIGAPEPAIDTSAQAPQPAEMPSLSQAVALAQARDPRLAAALSQLQAAEKQTTAVGAELRPDLFVSAGISGRAGGAPASGNPTPPQPTGAGWIPDVPNWDVGVVLSWPLFDGTIAARRDAAKAQEQVRHDEVDAVRLQEVAAVNESYIQVQVARTALVGLQNTVVAARANYDQADARFKAGIGNAVELADAEAVRTDAEIQLALGQFELARARAAFGRAIAEGL
ncbi:MAG TPA: TolC family protein [Polyangiaceae bacterium]